MFAVRETAKVNIVPSHKGALRKLRLFYIFIYVVYAYVICSLYVLRLIINMSIA